MGINLNQNTKKCIKSIIIFLKQKWWYILLLLSSSIYVWSYRNNIYQLKEINTQNLIFMVWLVLLILPLFSEIEFLGIKVKKEVEKLTGEVKEGLSEIRLQVMDLKVSNSIAIQVGNAPLPPKDELKKLLQEFSDSLKNMDVDISEVKREPILQESDYLLGITEQSIFLFKVRLTLENALTSLCDKTGYTGNKSLSQMLKYLNLSEVINRKTVELLDQINKISTRGVHGEIISDEYIDFIKQVYPSALLQLRKENSAFQPFVCPLCHFTGYSKYENVCPICGFTHDE